MTVITPVLVKELRDRTQAGMMECKRALAASDGDLDQAFLLLHQDGLAKADKKSARQTAEGRIGWAIQAGGEAALVEVNAETAFLSKEDNFQAFVAIAAIAALSPDVHAVEDLMAAQVDGVPLEQLRLALVAKLGENIQVRRFVRSQVSGDGASATAYVHDGRIGVLIETDGADSELASGLAMHIAAAAPSCVQGAPDSLHEQAYALYPSRTVAEVLFAAGARVVSFQRLVLGDGIEKTVEDYAAEVLKQIRPA